MSIKTSKTFRFNSKIIFEAHIGFFEMCDTRRRAKIRGAGGKSVFAEKAKANLITFNYQNGAIFLVLLCSYVKVFRKYGVYVDS